MEKIMKKENKEEYVFVVQEYYNKGNAKIRKVIGVYSNAEKANIVVREILNKIFRKYNVYTMRELEEIEVDGIPTIAGEMSGQFYIDKGDMHYAVYTEKMLLNKNYNTLDIF